MDKKNWKQTTIASQGGIDTDSTHGSVLQPIYLSSNYTFDGYDNKRQYDYSRSGNPTRDTLERVLADLEGGYDAVITSTGMSALHLMFLLLTADDLIIVPHDCYGGTHRLLTACGERKQFKVNFVDLTNKDNLEKAFADKPAMVLIETPSNPLLRITDIKNIVEMAHEVGALVAVDNTFMSPVQQTPLALGADMVMHSTTKYLNGHGDVVGGAVIAKTKELYEKLAWWANCTGITGAPFDSYMTLRGVRSLIPRMQYQTKTASKIADFLDENIHVVNVNYPGLKSHKGHEIAAKQQKDFGAMLSFEIDGDVNDVIAFIDNLSGGEGKLFTLAESLGGFESLIAHPATMTHAAMTEEARKTAGIGDTLLRLSIGLEDVDDLIATLEHAFAATYQKGKKQQCL